MAWAAAAAAARAGVEADEGGRPVVLEGLTDGQQKGVNKIAMKKIL
jgi:hypothetical protein